MQQLIAFDRRSIQLLGEPTNSQMQAQPKEDEEQRKEQDQTTLTVGDDATENTKWMNCFEVCPVVNNESNQQGL